MVKKKKVMINVQKERKVIEYDNCVVIEPIGKDADIRVRVRNDGIITIIYADKAMAPSHTIDANEIVSGESEEEPESQVGRKGITR